MSMADIKYYTNKYHAEGPACQTITYTQAPNDVILKLEPKPAEFIQKSYYGDNRF